MFIDSVVEFLLLQTFFGGLVQEVLDELVEILNDPANPDHADRLDWLGLDNADDFDPASFDADTVTTRLARIR